MQVPRWESVLPLRFFMEISLFPGTVQSQDYRPGKMVVAESLGEEANLAISAGLSPISNS